MRRAHHWLTELRLHIYDERWFKQHSAELLDDLEYGLTQQKMLKAWLPVLRLALPFLRWDAALAPWYTLIKAVEDDIYGLGHEQLQVDVCNAIGNFYLLFSKIDDAEIAFVVALLAAADMHPVYSKGYLDAIIGLLWLQPKLPDPTLNFSQVSSFLEFSGYLRSPGLTAQLHQALASACLHWDHFEQAREFAQSAYNYWNTQTPVSSKPYTRHEIEFQRGQSTHLLAIAFRMLCDDDSADESLALAQTHFVKTPYIWQHSAMPYEIAVSHYRRGQWADALTWLDVSLNEAFAFDDDMRYQRIYHMKGMVLLWDCDAFDEARQNLNRALEIARTCNCLRDEVHTRHTRAFLTAREGNFKAARIDCEYGLRLCEQIKHERVCHAMMKLYNELLEMIAENHPLLNECE